MKFGSDTEAPDVSDYQADYECESSNGMNIVSLRRTISAEIAYSWNKGIAPDESKFEMKSNEGCIYLAKLQK